MTVPPGNVWTPARKVRGVFATLPSGQNGGYILGRTSSGEGPVEILSLPWLMRKAARLLQGIGICGGIPYYVNSHYQASSQELKQDALVLGGGCLPPTGGGWQNNSGFTYTNNTRTALATAYPFKSTLSTSVGGRHTGKWYAVLSIDAVDGGTFVGVPIPAPAIGVGNTSMGLSNYPGADSHGASFYGQYFFTTPEFVGAGSSDNTTLISRLPSTPVSCTLAINLDANQIYLKTNGTWQPRAPNLGNGFDIASVNDGVEVFLAFGGVTFNGGASQVTLETAILDGDAALNGYARWAGADTGQPPYTNSQWTIPVGTSVLTGGNSASQVIASPTGGSEGAGTINVSGGYFLNGVNVGGRLIGTVAQVTAGGDIYITG